MVMVVSTTRSAWGDVMRCVFVATPQERSSSRWCASALRWGRAEGHPRTDAQRRGRGPWTTSYDQLLERCDPVAIATPTGSHAELVMAAARARRPVFCEKPISSD